MSGRLPGPGEEYDEHQDQELDRDLSALVDGELSPERERALRARVAEDPRLAARLSELERVDVALRAMPRAAMSPQRQEELQQELRVRIASRGEVLRSYPRRRRVWAAAALAAAASLAIYLALPGPGSQQSSGPQVAVEAELETVSDEEIGIALDYDVLADLDVIEDLELLELMIELEEEAERG